MHVFFVENWHINESNFKLVLLYEVLFKKNHELVNAVESESIGKRKDFIV